MTVYDYLILSLANSPITSLFRFCIQNNLNYGYAWKNMQRASDRQHITIKQINNQCGHPVQLELTPRGRSYAKAIRPIKKDKR